MVCNFCGFWWMFFIVNVDFEGWGKKIILWSGNDSNCLWWYMFTTSHFILVTSILMICWQSNVWNLLFSYPHYTQESPYQPFRVSLLGVSSIELALTSPCLQVGPDQYEKASAAGGGTGNPFEGGFGNPFEDLFPGGGAGGGGMNDVCHPFTNLFVIPIAFTFSTMFELLVCFFST